MAQSRLTANLSTEHLCCWTAPDGRSCAMAKKTGYSACWRHLPSLLSCLLAFLLALMLACPPSWLLALLLACLLALLLACFLPCLLACLPALLPAGLLALMSACLLSCLGLRGLLRLPPAGGLAGKSAQLKTTRSGAQAPRGAQLPALEPPAIASRHLRGGLRPTQSFRSPPSSVGRAQGP